MSISNFDEARRAHFEHADHALEIVGYGPGGFGNEVNIAIECTDCCVVLMDWDKYE